MATTYSLRSALIKRMKFRKALESAKRMRDLLGSKGTHFMTFALTSLHALRADTSLDAREFSKRIDAEVENLYARYLDYKHASA